MTGYTPTTEEVREAIAEWVWSRRMFRPEFEASDGREADRWLAAHDAEMRANVVAEEPELEVGVSYSTDTGPSIDGYRLRRYMQVESVEKARAFAALVERPIIQKRTKAVPAGEWVRVPVEQGDET